MAKGTHTTNTQFGIQIQATTLEDLIPAINGAFAQLSNILDSLNGVRGTPTFYTAPDFQGHRAMKVGEPQADDDAEIRGRSLRRPGPGQAFDAQNQVIVNVGDPRQQLDAVNLRTLEKKMSVGEGLKKPLAAPPEVEDASSIGADNGRGAFEGHTHSGANLTDAQTINGVKTITLPVLGTTRFVEAGLTLANGANDNVALPAGTIFRITGPSAGFSISGLTGGAAGRFVVLWNDVAQAMTITNLGAGSAAANQINTLTGADIVTTTQGAIALFYSTTDNLWRVMGSQL